MSCSEPEEDRFIWKSIEVTATAFNSVPAQTDAYPNITAWGDTLKVGMKCIAVSRDLLRIGIQHNTPVKIEGLEGVYLVKDKMNKRYSRKIDLYMDTDIQKALEWGRKKVCIEYGVLNEKYAKLQ